MTDLAPAAVPLAPEFHGLDLPRRLLDDAAAAPEFAGDLLLEHAGDLVRAGRSEQARRLLSTVREHPPAPEDGQYAAVELARLLREEPRVRDTAEAERITGQLLSPGGLGEGPAQVLGEDLQELERWEEALRCYNISARELLAQPAEALDGEDALTLTPLIGRLLMRMRLGLPADAHDEVALEAAERRTGDLLEPFDHEEEPDEAEGVEALYSRAAFDEARERGLLTGAAAEDGVGAYYRAAERSLRERAREYPQTRWNVVLLSTAEAVAAAERAGADLSEEGTGLGEAGFAVDDPRLRPWPPQRNDSCWCASGRKYKKCCGAPANR
ncbi:SEC-C domain-containing protein [Nocardiopsis sp. CNT312]|uniref:SEC-C domain-containing protein n=1 Tax=Nocardiopsis sp. CNT312 TaxID=1137268 RepID=UPI00048EA9B5|nr:SEC-C domain-containing protein [Nocardiopsis sp. CNT312]